MKLLLAYLRARPFFALSALLLCVFACVFALCDLPLGAVGYAFALCAALLLALGAADFARFRRRHAQLRRAGADLRAALPLLPEPRDLIEADYQALLRGAADGWTREVEDVQARYEERMDYFTLWAHQIKTPIAAMRLRLSEEENDLSRALRAELMSVERYVEMAMCYLRLSAQSTDYAFAPCDLGALSRACVRKLAPLFIGGRLRVRVEADGVTALTDEKWLAFVIEQLLTNAIKYTRAGGEVSVTAEEGPVLVIADTGAGIAPEDLPRVTEPGFTGRAGREDKRASGLGLYLCKRVTDALGHGLSIDSKPGEGTRVRLDLHTRRLIGE